VTTRSRPWKLTPADWENRRKRPQYLEAIEDMLARTDHDPSPWHLVEAESKKYARVKIVETVIERIEQGMRARQIEPPAFGT
jgi:polyphosphate kinase 2 (PPK2 family)